MMNLKEISEALAIPFVGDGEITILGPAEPRSAKKTDLALAMDKKFFADLKKSKAKAAILMIGTDWKELGLSGALIVDNSRYALSKITTLFQEPIDFISGIHPTAIVSKTVSLGKNVSIGPFSVIRGGTKIAENSIILSHVYIGHNVDLGNNGLIHPGVRIGSKVKIGDRFICHQNAVIGCDGFSFVSPIATKQEGGKGESNNNNDSNNFSHDRIASLGGVYIGDDVEIGASCAIDKGTIESTRIGNGTKLDNMVHIGHNVTIGNDCLLCGQVGIAGSAKIGNQVILGGQVGIADHISVGDSCIIAGKSGVSSNVPKQQFMMGNPAMKIENNIETYKSLRRLPRILKQIQKLQKVVLEKGLDQ